LSVGEIRALLQALFFFYIFQKRRQIMVDLNMVEMGKYIQEGFKMGLEGKGRPGWDSYGMALAKAASIRADCTRSKVGAIALSSNHRVLGAGYNGYPSGAVGCIDGGCPRGRLSHEELPHGGSYLEGPGLCGALHAEENLIMWLSADQRKGATIYITRKPCLNCSRLLRGTGFARAVWLEDDILMNEEVYS
jgi:dCMP deaminase